MSNDELPTSAEEIIQIRQSGLESRQVYSRNKESLVAYRLADDQHNLQDIAKQLLEGGRWNEESNTYHWGPKMLNPNDQRCKWKSGNSEMARDEIGMIEAEWMVTKKSMLTVRFSGFLRVGKNTTVEVRWISADGTEKGSGESRISVVNLAARSSQLPEQTDRLHVRHVRNYLNPQTSEFEQWDVCVEISFHDL